MNIGQRVKLISSESKSLTGEVAGTGSWIVDGEIRTGFLVKLDHGFYSPNNTTYISMVVAVRSSLEMLFHPIG